MSIGKREGAGEGEVNAEAQRRGGAKKGKKNFFSWFLSPSAPPRLCASALTSLSLALSLFLSPACTSKSPPSRPKTQELRLALKSDPPTLDPRKSFDSVCVTLTTLCFEGLMRADSEGNATLALAEKVEISEDQLHYLFTLRDALWSDGKSVSAHDFEKAWKTMLDPEFGCEFASNLYGIKHARAAHMGRCSVEEIGIYALDDKTLQVDLEHPLPYFLSSLASYSFMPAPSHIVDLCKQYVSNGPFSLDHYSPHQEIVLKKNPLYWDREQVRLEQVHFFLIPDEGTELSMFERGELDWAGSPLSNLPVDALSSLAGKLHTHPIAGTYSYIFNTTQFPFNNAHVRQAFALAIHRQEIVTNVTQTHETIATGFVPPFLGKEQISYFQDDDRQRAVQCLKKGLEELGITREQLPPLELSYNTLSGHHKIAQAIQQQWRSVLKVDVKLVNKEWKMFMSDLRQGKFQIARMGSIAAFSDPIACLNGYRYVSSTLNYPRWHHSEFSELLEKADFTTDEVERLHLLSRAEEILLREMPVAPIYFYTGVYVKKPYVQGVYISKLGQIDLKGAYISD